MNASLQSSYDRVAEQYAEQFRDELDKKPFDRKMLDWLAEKVDDLGVICDMGYGLGRCPTTACTGAWPRDWHGREIGMRLGPVLPAVRRTAFSQ